MTDWQQALDQKLVRRLQPPLAKKNIGQRLVDRTDHFLTRFSLVEQQFQRWGNFQATNPNPVPIVFAKPTQSAATSSSLTTPPISAAIATSSPSPSITTTNNPASDVFVQRKIDPTISAPRVSTDVATPTNASPPNLIDSESIAESSITENISEPNLSPPLAEISPDVIFVENAEANNPRVASDLPLLDNTSTTSSSEATIIPADILSQVPLPLVDSLDAQPKLIAKETTSPDTQLVAPADNLTDIDPASEELVLRRSPDSPSLSQTQNTDNSASDDLTQRRSPDLSILSQTQNEAPLDFDPTQNTAITSQLITAQFSDVPLVLAQPVAPTLPAEPQRQVSESLPVVRTRLEQLLNQKKSRSTLPTVQPQKVAEKSFQSVVTPLSNPVNRNVETTATSPVQPLPTVQNSAQIPTLSFGNGANITQGRSPTSPLSNFPKSPSPTTQTNAQISNPNIQAAKNPVVETFRAPSMDNSAPPKVDIQAIADQVEKKIRRRIVVESERRGQGRWR